MEVTIPFQAYRLIRDMISYCDKCKTWHWKEGTMREKDVELSDFLKSLVYYYESSKKEPLGKFLVKRFAIYDSEILHSESNEKIVQIFSEKYIKR